MSGPGPAGAANEGVAGAGKPRASVAVTGSSGLIGQALTIELLETSHRVTRVVRSRKRAQEPGCVYWDPASAAVDASGLEGHDVVVHLAAESLFGLWTSGRKRRIRASRVRGTRFLAETLARLERPPGLLITASAVGYYGDRDPELRLDESAGRGEGFLAELVEEWEGAADPARAAGTRVVHTRFGIVLSPRGGALALMLPVFRLGLGGRVGGGRQAFPWVALHEIPGVMRFLIKEEALSGPVNVVAPELVSHREFVETVGDVLSRPTLLRIPELAVRALGGSMAKETVLVSTPAVPSALEEAGYRFRYPRLERALREEIALA